MRIVQVANFYGPRSGGIRTTLHQLALGYAEHGHESVIVVPGQRGSDVTTEHGRVVTLPGATVPRSGGYRVITDVDSLCTLLQELGPDRLEVSDRTTLRSVGWWASAAGVPSTLWVHERVDGVLSALLPGPWPTRRLADAWNRATVRRFDRVVCTTAYARAELDRIGWTPVSQVALGVDLASFHPSAYDDGVRARLLDGDEVLLATCSRLSPEKRPQDAVATLVELRRRGVRARLVVLGDGPLRPRMERESAGLPVHLLGHVADRAAVASLLASADVVLAPGPVETFGLAALEALASGTPVVASGSSALGEVVGGGGRAVHGGPVAYADAVQALLHQVGARERARARAEQFPWSRTVRSMLALHGLSPATEAV